MHFWPGPAGAKEWTHACYSPKTELLYVPVQDVGATATRRRREFKESIPYWGAGVAVDGSTTMSGYVSAYDPRTGQERWRWSNDIRDVLVVARHRRRPRVRRGADRRVQRARRQQRRAAVAVPVRQRPPQQPVDLQRRRTAVRRRADRLGRLGRGVPARDARVRPTEARCSPSRCRSSNRRIRVVIGHASRRGRCTGIPSPSMIGNLLILGFTLSLDNFRTAIALGAVQPTWRRSVQVAVMFGFWDGVAPLIGILIGHYWSEAFGSTGRVCRSDRAGRVRAVSRLPGMADPGARTIDQPWAVFGLLVPLSAGQRRRRHELGPARGAPVARAAAVRRHDGR